MLKAKKSEKKFGYVEKMSYICNVKNKQRIIIKKKNKMSGTQKLNRAIKNKRVVAFTRRKKEKVATDANGTPILDKNGNKVTEEVQLYRIKPLR